MNICLFLYRMQEAGAAAEDGLILLESGGELLLESGDNVLLEGAL